jgi:hypothetical protein
MGLHSMILNYTLGLLLKCDITTIILTGHQFLTTMDSSKLLIIGIMELGSQHSKQ